MTVLCGGGTSGQIPGVAQQVIFSSALITEGLGLISPWLLPFAILIDTFVYAASSNCATDPPAMPTVAQLDPLNAVGGILNPNFASWKTAVNNLILNWGWSQFCQCTSGPQPTFTYPPPPADSIIPINPAASVCFQGSYNGPSINNTTTPFGNAASALPPGPQIVNDGAPGNTTTTKLSTVGLYTSVYSTITWTFDPLGTQQGAFRFGYWNADGTLNSLGPLTTVPFQANGGSISRQGVQTIPALAAFINCTAGPSGTDAHPPTITLTNTFYCGGATQGSPCTPGCSDPAILQLLNTLLGLTNSIFQSLPTQPNSYSESTVHSGLTNNGTLTIAASTIAIKVIITTDLPGGRIDLASPNYLFNRGYIVPIAAEGPIRGITRLVYNPQLYVLPHLTQQVGFSFPGGQVVTIIELTRGP